MPFSFILLIGLTLTIGLLHAVMWYLYVKGKAIWRGRHVTATPLIILAGVSVVVLSVGWLLHSMANRLP